MANQTPIPVQRSLRLLGEYVATWRKLNNLPVAVVADRANISRSTLNAIESGRGGVSIENVLRVLRALGVMDTMVDSIDPYETDMGRLRADQKLPKRIRS